MVRGASAPTIIDRVCRHQEREEAGVRALELCKRNGSELSPGAVHYAHAVLRGLGDSLRVRFVLLP